MWCHWTLEGPRSPLWPLVFQAISGGTGPAPAPGSAWRCLGSGAGGALPKPEWQLAPLFPAVRWPARWWYGWAPRQTSRFHVQRPSSSNPLPSALCPSLVLLVRVCVWYDSSWPNLAALHLGTSFKLRPGRSICLVSLASQAETVARVDAARDGSPTSLTRTPLCVF